MILTDRFWAKVVQDGDCWRWTAAKTRGGYGQWAVNGVSKSVHRLTYTELRADIPDGLSIDHLCQNKWCCNPWHLEPVTVAVNNRRKPNSRRCDHGRHDWEPCHCDPPKPDRPVNSFFSNWIREHCPQLLEKAAS